MAFHSLKSIEDLRIKDDGFSTHTTEEQVAVLLFEITKIFFYFLHKHTYISVVNLFDKNLQFVLF